VNAQPETFQGEIRVSSRIVDALSSGLYDSPAACLKELVNNSFDADAETVRVFVKPDADRIVISDDGLGMSRKEFEDHFSRISESHKRVGADRTPSGRLLIGKIGIGFIAANEICEVMEIYSTKRGSRDLLHVAIDFARLALPQEERLTQDGEVAKGDYRGEILEANEDDHFTEVVLTRVRGESREVLVSAAKRGNAPGLPSLYGQSADSIHEILCERPPRDWRDFDRYSETMLRIAHSVPVQYYEHWMPIRNRRVRELEKEVTDLGFTVYYDETELKKPSVFCPGPGRKVLLDTFEHSGEHVNARGYFYVEHGALTPQNLNGLLIRIRNAAVGEYDRSFLQFPTSIGTVFQRWISAEVWADDQLEDAMNIDRRTLRTTHPAYVELQGVVHRRLRRVLDRARDELYSSGSDERRSRKAGQVAARIEQVAEKLTRTSPALSAALRRSWKPDESGPNRERALLKTYSTADVYDIVTEAAQDLLEPKELAELIVRLSRRLRR